MNEKERTSPAIYQKDTIAYYCERGMKSDKEIEAEMIITASK